MVRDCLARCGDMAAPGQSYCTACQRARWRARNAARAGSLEVAVYQSSAYRKARTAVLAGATHCATCRGHTSQVGKLTAGHVRPIRDDLAAATSPAGLIPQCRSCQEFEKHRRAPR